MKGKTADCPGAPPVTATSLYQGGPWSRQINQKIPLPSPENILGAREGLAQVCGLCGTTGHKTLRGSDGRRCVKYPRGKQGRPPKKTGGAKKTAPKKTAGVKKTAPKKKIAPAKIAPAKNYVDFVPEFVIDASQKKRNGPLHYLVKWVGSEDMTWERSQKVRPRLRLRSTQVCIYYVCCARASWKRS